ncbi:MAG: hypothetical protein Tsb0020_48890 [Haliangiales bacterium]
MSPPMSTAREFWQTLYQRFDPEEPARTRDWRVERPQSPLNDIRAALNRPFGGPPRYLLIGTVGTGKTTELIALAEHQVERRVVVFLDVRRHFVESVHDPAALDSVQPWEVLVLIGLAVYRTASECLGHKWAEQHLESFRSALVECATGSDEADKAPSVDIPKLAGALAVSAGGAVGGVAGLGLSVLGGASRAVGWSLPLGRRRRTLPDQDQRVLSLANAVNALIGTVQHNYQPLLIVLDGLDRISDAKTVKNLFLESSLLGGLACASVIAGPIVLRRQGLAAQVRWFEPKVLANAPVVDAHAPAQHGPGVAFLREVYQRRVNDLEGAHIPPELIDKLAYYSGGRGRDFVHLVRNVAERAWDRDLAAADLAVVDDAIDERRRLREMGLDRRDIDILRAVVDDPDRRLPDDERVASLLDRFCLLPYPNRSEWYFPHPLLTLALVPTATTPG